MQLDFLCSKKIMRVARVCRIEHIYAVSFHFLYYAHLLHDFDSRIIDQKDLHEQGSIRISILAFQLVCVRSWLGFGHFLITNEIQNYTMLHVR